MKKWLDKNGDLLSVGISSVLLILWIFITGCTTALPGTKDTTGRKYMVPINLNAPEELAAGATNYQ